MSKIFFTADLHLGHSNMGTLRTGDIGYTISNPSKPDIDIAFTTRIASKDIEK